MTRSGILWTDLFDILLFMANCFLQKTFHFETECQRRDAPKEDVGAWLKSQSLEQAKVETGFEWRVDRTHLEKQDDGTHFYTVTMRCLSNVPRQVSLAGGGK